MREKRRFGADFRRIIRIANRHDFIAANHRDACTPAITNPVERLSRSARHD